MMEANIAAVKLEGSAVMAPTVQFLVERGIPVMAHIGLMPQFVNTMGGFKAQGMGERSADAIREAALAMEAAGAFCIVLEGVAEPLARELTEALRVPTIGIGASPACDGQVLVIEDILGQGGSSYRVSLNVMPMCMRWGGTHRMSVRAVSLSSRTALAWSADWRCATRGLPHFTRLPCWQVSEYTEEGRSFSVIRSVMNQLQP